MSKINSEDMLDKIIDRGIPKERIDMLKHSGVDLDQWLKSFDSVEASVTDSVNVIKHHPLFLTMSRCTVW